MNQKFELQEWQKEMIEDMKKWNKIIVLLNRNMWKKYFITYLKNNHPDLYNEYILSRKEITDNWLKLWLVIIDDIV